MVKLGGARTRHGDDPREGGVPIAEAEGFFASFTPAEAGALGKTSTARTNALGWAATFTSYNEGASGPGHCDE